MNQTIIIMHKQLPITCVMYSPEYSVTFVKANSVNGLTPTSNKT